MSAGEHESAGYRSVHKCYYWDSLERTVCPGDRNGDLRRHTERLRAGLPCRGNRAPIKFKHRPGHGGVIENIVHENWKIGNSETVIDHALRSVDGKSYIDEWFKVEVPFEKATPRYRNITLRNIKAVRSARSISLLGWPLAHFENVILEDIMIGSDIGAQFQYIDNLLLKNVAIKTAGEPMRFKAASITPSPNYEKKI